MRIIETEEAARRLARAIASDLSLYNEEKILNGLKNDNLCWISFFIDPIVSYQKPSKIINNVYVKV